VIPARTSLHSHAPAFMIPTCGLSHSCEYAAHESKNASHIATLALAVPIPAVVIVFFFFFLKAIIKCCLTRSRHKRSLCPSAPRVLAARAGLQFLVFFKCLVEVNFSSFFDLSNNFFVINIIINTSLASSHHQNLLSTRHEIVKTRQHTKNGQKWSFFRVLEKGLKMAVFGLFLTSSKIDVFLTSSHHQHIKKWGLKKVFKKKCHFEKNRKFFKKNFSKSAGNYRKLLHNYWSDPSRSPGRVGK
jgi:hypothetical protein